MADAVLSVRIDEELKNRFMELAQENGVNNKDLMQLLVAQFELGQISDGTTYFSQDIDELQRLTKRMAEIYLNMMERVQLKELEKKNKENIKLLKQEEELEKLKEQLKQLEEKDKLLQQLKDQIKALKKDLVVSKDEQVNLKDLNDLLREKNSLLEKEFSQMKAKIETADEVLESNAQLKAAVADKEEENHRNKLKLELLETEKNQLEQTYLEKECKLQEKMAEELQLLKRMHAIELQEMKLSLQKDYMDQFEQLRQQNDVLVNSLEVENKELKEKVEQFNREYK